MGIADWSESNNEAVQTYKEVGLLAGTTMASSAVFGGIAAYSHAKDPATGGMPALGPVGIDAIVGGVALVGAVVGGNFLGSMGQTAALGIALGGLASASNGWGSKAGVAIHEAMKPKGAGVGAMGEGGLSQEAADALREYRGH